MTIKTYPEMNARIVDLLRLFGERLVLLYAAQRIEELEAEAGQLQRDLHDEQIRRDEWEKMYSQSIAEYTPNALPCGYPHSARCDDSTDSHDITVSNCTIWELNETEVTE